MWPFLLADYAFASEGSQAGFRSAMIAGEQEAWLATVLESSILPGLELIMRSEDQTFAKGDGNAVVSAVGLWAARDGIHLRIDTTDEGAQPTATDGRGAARDHRILLRDLRQVLMADGCWAGDEGATAQSTGSAGD